MYLSVYCYCGERAKNYKLDAGSISRCRWPVCLMFFVYILGKHIEIKWSDSYTLVIKFLAVGHPFQINLYGTVLCRLLAIGEILISSCILMCDSC